METRKLQESLAQIHEELGSTAQVDDDTRALLAQLGADIARLLEQPRDDRDAEDKSVLAERLRGAVGEFEATHPRLTETLARLADTLSGMGI